MNFTKNPDEFRHRISILLERLGREFQKSEFQHAIYICFQLRDLIREYDKSYGQDDDHKHIIFYLKYMEELFMAELYQNLGDLKQVEQCRNAAKELVRATTSSWYPDLATSLNFIGNKYQREAFYSVAKVYYQQSLEIRRKIFGENHPDYVVSLNKVSEIYLDMCNYVEAEKHCALALQVAENLLENSHPEFITALNNLARVNQENCNYLQAEQCCLRALRIGDDAFERKLISTKYGSPEFAKSLGVLGRVYLDKGNYLKAEKNLVNAERIYDSLDIFDVYIVTILENLVELYILVGDYNKAFEYGAKSSNAGARWNPFYSEEERANHPVDATKKVIMKLLERLTPLRGHHLLSLGGVLDIPFPSDVFERALGIYRRRFGQNHRLVATCLNHLSVAFLKREPVKSKNCLLEALNICHKLYGQNHKDTAMILDNLAKAYGQTMEIDKAEQCCRQSLEIRRKMFGENHQDYAASLNTLASIFVLNYPAKALSLMEEANAIDDGMIAQIFCIPSDERRVLFIESIQHRYYIFLSLIVKNFSHDRKAIRKAMDLVLKRKAITLEGSRFHKELESNDRPELREKYYELEAIRREISIIGRPAFNWIIGMRFIANEAQQEKLYELLDTEEMLETELANLIFESKDRIKWQNLNRLVNALPKDTALVEFVGLNFLEFNDELLDDTMPTSHFKGDDKKFSRYVAFILVNDNSDNIRMVDLGEAEEIDRSITLFRESITGEVEVFHESLPKLNENRKYGTLVRKKIFDPLKIELRNVRNIIIAPDGNITRLPIDALPLKHSIFSRTHGQLIEVVNITYVNSSRDIFRFGTVSKIAPNESLVLADPDFDYGNDNAHKHSVTVEIDERGEEITDISKLHFDPLPETKFEGEVVGKLLGVQPIFGRSVLKGKLMNCKSPCVLHIATHAIFARFNANENPDPTPMWEYDPSESVTTKRQNTYSAIALAGANAWLAGKSNLPEEAGNCILFHDDVREMDLSNTKLVVLSACETALGEVHVGESVNGFPREFTMAGAQTLVMSLWRVPDAETRELMTDFYQRMINGVPRAEALHKAKLALRKNHRSPSYWGAFISYGDPSSLNC